MSLAERYAAGTLAAWDRKMAREEAAEARAEARLDYWAGRPHPYVDDPIRRGLCARCGTTHRRAA